jgi:hypothetical protein
VGHGIERTGVELDVRAFRRGRCAQGQGSDSPGPSSFRPERHVPRVYPGPWFVPFAELRPRSPNVRPIQREPPRSKSGALSRTRLTAADVL